MTEQKFEMTDENGSELSPQEVERQIRARVQELAESISKLSTVEYHLNGLRKALPGAEPAVFAPVETWLRQRQRTALMETFELLEDVTGETDHALRSSGPEREDS